MKNETKNQPSKTIEKRVCLGKITSPHGIKGLVKFFAYGEDPSLIETLGPPYMAEIGEKTLCLTLKNALGKSILASVEGCTTREQAEALAGTELYVLKSALPCLDDTDSFYIEDLIGLECVSPDDAVIGRVKAVHNFGAGDLLEIAFAGGGEDALIPFTAEYVGVIEAERITIIKTALFED